MQWVFLLSGAIVVLLWAYLTYMYFAVLFILPKEKIFQELFLLQGDLELRCLYLLT